MGESVIAVLWVALRRGECPTVSTDKGFGPLCLCNTQAVDRLAEAVAREVLDAVVAVDNGMPSEVGPDKVFEPANFVAFRSEEEECVPVDSGSVATG